MPNAPVKTDADRLHDAQDIIRLTQRELRDANQQIRTLQREEDDAEKIRRVIWGLAEHNPEPPAWISGKGGKIGSRGCPITVCSDSHYGEVVNPDEVNGVNEYNKNVAKKRLKTYFDSVIDLSYNHMGRAKTEYPGLIMCLGGDMLGGDIHEELANTNDRTPQQAVDDLTDLLAAGIERFAGAFGRVYVPSVVGNHGRSTKRPVMKRRVFTNYDWSIYCNLARHFRKDKNVQIDVPNGADAHFKSFGTRFMLTHGDALGVKGGDGIIGAIGPIMRGSMKVGLSEQQVGHDFDHLIMCHWHQMLWLPNVTVNNSIKGYDEYVHLGLRARYSRPSQALFFNHPEHGITARWEVFLEGKKTALEDKVWASWYK